MRYWLMGASPEASFTYARTHHATEEMIRGAGVEFVFLRPSFYLDYVADWADAEGINVKFSPTPDFDKLVRSRVAGNNLPDIAILHKRVFSSDP